MGTLQATEVLKEILGVGESLSGKLLIWDALATRFRTVRLRADPDCALCGPAATIRDLSLHRDARRRLCRLSRSASCCCPVRIDARITHSCCLRCGGAGAARGAVRHQRRLPRAVHRLVRPDGRGRDARVRAAGVAGLDELREAAREMGVRLIACEAVCGSRASMRRG